MPLYVIKSDKTKEEYREEKVISALKRAKVSEEDIEKILKKIKEKLPEVVTTKELYKFIFEELKKEKRSGAYRFNLKNSLYLLGPSGYPFEKYIAHLFKEYGYFAKHNLIFKGFCLSYEIDILIEKNDEKFLGECKFHQEKGKKNDIKTVLYAYARHLDILKTNKDYKLLLVTNTKFTSEAIEFAKCYSINLLSWNFPLEKNLPQLIEEKRFYPLTIFDFLSKKTLTSLFNYDIVSIKDFLNKDDGYLKKISGLNEEEIKNLKSIIEEILVV